jgi:beta-1,2-mannobiose phosphorylase / 1,2-beta-oligomannan phosphorylase
MPAHFPLPFPIPPGNRSWRCFTVRSFWEPLPRRRHATPPPDEVDLDRESIWICYRPISLEAFQPGLVDQFSHHRLATPISPWEKLKIGCGTPPILTRHGWLVVYHGVSESGQPSNGVHHLCYSAGVMVLSKEQPQVIRYRSAKPVLSPTWCSPVASTGATTSAHRTASMSITEWPTTDGRQPNWRGSP